jgi:hypothetical protein
MADSLSHNDKIPDFTDIQNTNKSDTKDSKTQISPVDIAFNIVKDSRLNYSMFNKHAILDYGRYRTATAWVNYKSEDDNHKEFKANNFSGETNDTIYTRLEGNNSIELITNGFDIPELIKWSTAYPALGLTYQDFAYCKRMGYYPNNRLIVLRRFKTGVPDNLFDYVNIGDSEATRPISTMITWANLDEKPMTLSYHENWSPVAEGGILGLLRSMLPTSGIAGTVVDAVDTAASFLLPVALNAEVFGKFNREDGLGWLDNQPGGDPNLINDAKVRNIAKSSGLDSKIMFNITFEYEMRYINGVDPGLAMLDLMANCLRMGTSTARFMYPIKSIKDNVMLNQAINANFKASTLGLDESILEFFESIQGQLSNIISFTTSISSGSSIADAFKKVKAEGFEVITDLFDTIKKAATKPNFNKLFEYIVSRYRERFKAAFAADTGLESGIWHVTIGNPTKPIIACGDLILDSAQIVLGQELGYNDAYTSFSCVVSLSSARPRGRDELERIFNAGRGRIYVYKHPDNNPDNFLIQKNRRQE